MAIQDVMVDMSLEDRQKFMDQIHSSMSNEQLESDGLMRRYGVDVDSFIKETDHRERLENPMGTRTNIPLGPQAEDDAG